MTQKKIIKNKNSRKKTQEMDEGDIIQMINAEICDNKLWTQKELLYGKEIEIFPEWEAQMQGIINQFKDCKWKVWWFVDEAKNRQYLSFENPWKKKN